ncbi:Ubiquinone biosynthesis O-methyltransferase [uncultured archaeon]|nr:Ubiquinone biosynthesis O-methyltransferase [uncultured archaeon]
MGRVEFALENLDGKILDVGYSVGGIHRKFIEKFGRGNVYGVDIETKKDSGHYKRASAEKIPFKNGFFDSVFAGELIEHLEKPGKFVSEANRVLKKGGALILTTPNRGSLVNRVFRNYETKVHLSLFDYAALRGLLEKNGFEVREYFCLPYSEENAYGSRNKWTFFFRNLLHGALPRGLQEEMVVKAAKKSGTEVK